MKKASRRDTLLVALVVSVILGASPVFADLFTPGDLYYISNDNPGNIYNITGGGDLSGLSPFATQGYRCPGQMTWSPDLTTMYSTAYQHNKVFSTSASGAVSYYASVSGPTGIVWTLDNRLLVVSYTGRCVYDITNPSSPRVVVSGLSAPRNIIQLPTGEILVADGSSSRKVWDISGGSLVAYASLPGSSYSVIDLDYTSDGHVFVTCGTQVYDITKGAVTPFAQSDVSLFGLAIDRNTDQIFAAPVGGNYVLDITDGGYVSYPSEAWAYSIPNTNDAALDFVPYTAVPVPGAVLLGVVGLSVAGSRLRRKTM